MNRLHQIDFSKYRKILLIPDENQHCEKEILMKKIEKSDLVLVLKDSKQNICKIYKNVYGPCMDVSLKDYELAKLLLNSGINDVV